MSALKRVQEIKLVPVVVLNKVEDTLPVIKALHDGDVPVAEICFRTDCAAECIKLAVKEFPNDLIGAGTVINAKQCQEAIDCGAKFIVSPGLSDEVARVCKENQIPYLPGVVTPTEVRTDEETKNCNSLRGRGATRAGTGETVQEWRNP